MKPYEPSRLALLYSKLCWPFFRWLAGVPKPENQTMNHMNQTIRRHWPLPVIFLAFLIAAIWTNHGGYLLFGEADHFLIDHNTDQRSWFSKVLSPHRVDAENYMARELAHAVENIDARFAHFCVMNGLPHFLSLSSYACFAIIASLFWFTALKFKLSRLTASLLLVLLFTTPCVFMSGPLMRPGHAVATMFMVALVTLLFRTYHEHEMTLGMGSFLAAVFTLSLLMVWADRQGLAAACSIALIYFCGGADQLQRKLVCSTITAAIVCHMIWYFFIGRNLVSAFTPFHDVVIPKNILAVSGGDKNMSWANFHGGFVIVFSNLRFICGSVPVAIAAGIALIAAVSFRKNWRVVAAVIGLIAVMNFIILGQAQPIIRPDCLPSIYYNIIGTTALWLLISRAALEFEFKFKNATAWVIGFLILSNLFALPGHVAGFKRGHLQGFIAGAPFLREALHQTVNQRDGTSTNRYDALESCHFGDWQWIMKNPLEYGGKLTAQEFVESSQYLQFVRSEKHLPFGRGGRKQGQQP